MKDYIIYRATHVPSGKAYIGYSTGLLSARKSRHENNAKNGSPFHFHRAIRKHGWESFKWEVIEYIDNDFKELKYKEKFWIKYYNTFNDGYNMTEGGEGTLGRKHTEETKALMSKIKKDQGCKMEKAIAASAKARLGKKMPKEVVDKVAKANTGSKRTPEQCANIGAKSKGRIPWNKGLKLTNRKRTK